MNEIPFGKIIVSTSYFDGNKINTKKSYSIPAKVLNKTEVLTEIIKAIELITSKVTHDVIVTIKSDKDYVLKTIIKDYIVEETNFNARS